MENHSKKTTDPGSGENQPVLVQGYERGWFSKGPSLGMSTTYLGIREAKHAYFNGTIFNIDSPDSLKQYDAREKNYCRILVRKNNIHLLSGRPLPQGQFWVYKQKAKFFAFPSVRYPIVESYVDIFLSGCIEIEEKYHLKDFSAQCITLTSHWSSYWVNDRIYPRRPFVYQPRAFQIDALLNHYQPTLFQKIKLEPSR